MRTFSNYKTFGKALESLWLGNIQIDPQSEDLGEIFEQHDKLVVACNHGPTFGPVAGTAGFVHHINNVGGGDRVGFAVTWKQFYDIPLIRQAARYITQIKKVESAEGFADRLKNGPYNDFWVAPEGDNCNFGNGLDVQPFLSPGFVEIAIRAGVPILVAMHQGSEDWAINLNINPRVQKAIGKLPVPARYKERLQETNTFSITNLFKGKLDNFTMSFALYQPTITVEELAEDKAERREQLWKEANNIREIMQQTVSRMREAEELQLAA